MTDDSWTDEAQRFLDGDGEPPGDATERGQAARFAAALGLYAAQLEVPSAELDERVLGAVRSRATRRAWWRWFVMPRRIVVRPVMAVAAAVALVVLSAVVGRVVVPGLSPVTSQTSPAPADGSVLVRFEYVAPSAHRVTLAGSFNGWNDSTITFSQGAQPGVWTVTVALPPGEYQYLFVVDGDRWIPDPDAHAQVEDDFGQTNSLLVVGPRGVVRS
jgi:hypothetical protein